VEGHRNHEGDDRQQRVPHLLIRNIHGRPWTV
jgi:hypothetical protein